MSSIIASSAFASAAPTIAPLKVTAKEPKPERGSKPLNLLLHVFTSTSYVSNGVTLKVHYRLFSDVNQFCEQRLIFYVQPLREIYLTPVIHFRPSQTKTPSQYRQSVPLSTTIPISGGRKRHLRARQSANIGAILCLRAESRVSKDATGRKRERVWADLCRGVGFGH